MDIRLARPTLADAERVMDYRREFLESGDSMDGTSCLRDCDTYADWYARLLDISSEETVRPGLVPETLFLAFDGRDTLVGMIDIRHRLNEYLLRFGGHIGYSVRRTQRKKGYATRMLALALRECRRLGIDRCLVTCDRDNIASAKTILKNGGVLENEAAEDGRITQRYWIETP